jgi:hypothetical protein
MPAAEGRAGGDQGGGEVPGGDAQRYGGGRAPRKGGEVLADTQQKRRPVGQRCGLNGRAETEQFGERQEVWGKSLCGQRNLQNKKRSKKRMRRFTSIRASVWEQSMLCLSMRANFQALVEPSPDHDLGIGYAQRLTGRSTYYSLPSYHCLTAQFVYVLNNAEAFRIVVWRQAKISPCHIPIAFNQTLEIISK